MPQNWKPVRTGFAIFRHTPCHGTLPACHDDLPVVFPSEFEAHCEIATSKITLFQQFLDREREFHDALSIEQFVLPVIVWPDGTVSTPDGRSYGKTK